MSKSEFQIGDIVHINNSKRVRGILNYNTENEQYKDFTIKSKHAIKIVSITKSPYVKEVGGFVYGAMVEYEGVEYYIDCFPQNNLASKKLWSALEEQDRIIAKLTKSK